MTDITLKYIGTQGGSIKVKGDVNEKSYSVSSGEEFYISGSKRDGKLSAEIKLTDRSGTEVAIHVSCSKPIGVGMVFGGKYVVVAGTTFSGTPLYENDIVQEPENKNLGLKLYPNPLRDHGNIEFTPMFDCKTRIELYDSTGHKVAKIYDKHTKKDKLVKVHFS